MIKVILRFLGLRILILLLIAGLGYFLYATTPGLRFELYLAEKFLPGNLQVGKIEGKLPAFSASDISYENKDVKVNLDHAALTWQPVSLLFSATLIDHLQLQRTVIQLKKNSEASSFTLSDFAFLKNISVHDAQLDEITIQKENAIIHVAGQIGKRWDIQWNVNIPQLANLLQNMKGDFSSSGKITGPLMTPTIDTEFTGRLLEFPQVKIRTLSGKANLNVQPKLNSTLSVNSTGLTIHSKSLKQLNFSVSGNLQLINRNLQATLAAIFLNQYKITAILSLPKFTSLHDFQQPIAGSIHSTLSDLHFLTRVFPQISNPQGILQTDLTLSGSLEKPQISAKAVLSNGSFAVPVLGIRPGINLQAAGDMNHQITFSGNLRSGKGTAQIQGTADLSQQDYPLQLQLQGQQLQAISLPEYNIVISPTVSLQFVRQNLQLQGDVQIPYANITPKNFNSTITLSDDVIFVSNKKQTPPLPFTTSLQLNLKLGDNIYIAYENLTTHLGGNVQLSEDPGGLITAAGELYAINGTYKAYGQTLSIQTGRLIYTGGSLMNPGLNISASKEIRSMGVGGTTSSFTNSTGLQPVYTGTETITVGVNVNGTLDFPVFALFSSPTMNQGDILSYLLFGYPRANSASTGQQAGAILGALSSLNPNTPSIGNFTEQLQQKLGFNELNLQSTEVFNPTTNSNVSTTSFVIGKQISSKLSIHYSVGIFYPVSILNLRYRFSKRWALQSETSSVDNGADFLYSIERD